MKLLSDLWTVTKAVAKCSWACVVGTYKAGRFTCKLARKSWAAVMLALAVLLTVFVTVWTLDGHCLDAGLRVVWEYWAMLVR
jgi:hypothetical protein